MTRQVATAERPEHQRRWCAVCHQHEVDAGSPHGWVRDPDVRVTVLQRQRQARRRDRRGEAA